MQFLSKLLGTGATDFINSVSDAVDKFTLSKEEKQEFKLQMQEYILKLEEKANEKYQTEITSRADIIKAEMAQGDKYTKRARPTIIYVGLAFIFIVHVLLPVFDFFFSSLSMPRDLKLPEEFWWAWGTIVSVYGAGRTAEKFGVANKLTQMITGSGVAKAGDKTGIYTNENNIAG